MKIILSRKGFDSSNGGCASPIFCTHENADNYEMISFPIPDAEGNVSYSELQWNNIAYSDLIENIYARRKPFPYDRCHLDPDLRGDIRKQPVAGWKPAFGQAGSALTILEKGKIDIGDIFLFYGWFRKASWNGMHWRFEKHAPDLHVIYGYLQIGSIEVSSKAREYSWHPHAGSEGHNAMYFPSETLKINNKTVAAKGYGTFSFAEELCLTQKGSTRRSYWKELPFFKDQWSKYKCDSEITYYKSPCIGQEFVFEMRDAESFDWLNKIFMCGLRL